METRLGNEANLELHLFLSLSSAFLMTVLPNSSFHVWVGLTSESQAQFRWFEPGLLSYTNWAPGEPVDNRQMKSPVLECFFIFL